MKELTYLASPFSHPDAAVRELRYEQVCRTAAILMRSGYKVFSPISHGYGINLASDQPNSSWQHWKAYDQAMLACCKEMLILTLSGWLQSEGIIAETAIAMHYDLPIRLVNQDGFITAYDCHQFLKDRQEAEHAGV